MLWLLRSSSTNQSILKYVNEIKTWREGYLVVLLPSWYFCCLSLSVLKVVKTIRGSQFFWWILVLNFWWIFYWMHPIFRIFFPYCLSQVNLESPLQAGVLLNVLAAWIDLWRVFAPVKDCKVRLLFSGLPRASVRVLNLVSSYHVKRQKKYFLINSQI